MFKKVLVWVGVGVMLIPPVGVDAYSVSPAKSYLESKAPSAWSTMALVAMGENGLSLEHLKGINSNNAIDYTAPILALGAAGSDVKNVNGVDYVAKLKSFYNGGQLGAPTLINDDIFGLLALVSAGEKTSSEALGTKTFIINNQNSDGGWGFVVGGGSDSNMTAVGVVSLVAFGVPSSDSSIVKGLDYLKTAQNSDGGFTYDPTSQYGTGSDSSSTAWVMWAIKAAGQDPNAWSKDGHTPKEFLESTQTVGGYFEYMPGSGEDTFTAVTTAYAVLALEGQVLPFGTGSGSGASTFQVRIDSSTGALCSANVAGPTALDLVKNASSVCGFTYNIKDTSFGPYLEQVGGLVASGTMGWLYAVNNTLPSVGAAEYQLAAGDKVWWHFGDFDWQPTESNGEVSLEVSVLPKEDVEGSTLGIVVNPSSLNYAGLKPGEAGQKVVNVQNIGTVDAIVSSEVSGDSVFTSGMTFDGLSWQDFEKQVAAGSEASLVAGLFIPAGASIGVYKGKVVFWAEAK